MDSAAERASVAEEDRQNREAQVEKALDDLEEHLEVLEKNPSAQQDTVCFKITKTVFTTPYLRPHLSNEQALETVQRLYSVLAQLSNPSVELFGLIDALLGRVSLSQIMRISPSIDLAAGLTVDADQYNSLTLNLLENADGAAAKGLATNFRNVFEALVRLFLCSHDIGISGRASAVLLKFLQEGNGEVSKRFFRDDGIYGAIFEICDSRQKVFEMTRNQRSIAQTRLLDFVTSLASWNWETAVKSHNPEVEAEYGLQPGEGLLDFATRYQTDFEDDVLLHRTLIDILKALLEHESSKSWSGEISPALKFLLSRKLHQQTMKYFLNPSDSSISSLDHSLLGPGSAAYTAAFIESHPNYIHNNPAIMEAIMQRLKFALQTNASPEILNVFSSVPRTMLRSYTQIVNEVPVAANNPSLLKALAYVFGGPEKPIEKFPPVENSQLLDIESEKVAASHLFLSYYTNNPRLFSELISIANRVALSESALAALQFLHSIIACNWTGPEQGITVIINDSRSRDAIMTYLRGFPNRVQGDPISRSNDQYKIAVFRYTLAKLFVEKLESLPERRSNADIVLWSSRLKDRIRLGVWGPTGSSVATEGS
jgi:hypothetical protein